MPTTITKKDVDNRGKRKSRSNLSLAHVESLTPNQKKAFELFDQGYHLLLHGSAGTGKTYLALYFALREMLRGKVDRVYIIRSVVSSRDIGFLPGTVKEKSRMYETPYYGLCSELFGRDDAYEVLKTKGQIEFETTSFMRGLTFRESVVIIDEVQNMKDVEILTIMTRIGENCRIIACGDSKQSDLEKETEKQGFWKFHSTIQDMSSVEEIQFTQSDIIRSDIVKEYLLARERNGF